MIGTLDIKVNAAHPNMPLSPVYTFLGSPQQVRVINVPKQIGNWKITAVQVTVNYPDNSSPSVGATLVGGCWSATLPAPSAVGQSLMGFKVTASGTDEHGDAITGYLLGKGDAYVLDDDATITVGGTTYYVHILDDVPESPRKGDLDISTMMIYDGSEWRPLGGSVPEGTMNHNEFSSISPDLNPEESSIGDVMNKLNKVIELLRGTSAALAVIFTLGSFGAVEVQTAKLSTLPGKTMIVTNITGAAAASDVPTDSTVAGWGYIKSWTETDPSVDGKISDHNSNHDAHDDIRDELWNIHEDISAKADNDMVNSGFESIYANFPDRVEMDDSIDDKISAHNTSINAHTDIRAALSDKQDVIADLNTIRSGAALGATALQSYTETDPTVPSWAKATSKPTYTWNEIGSKPTTLVGYGITDAYTKAQVDTALNAKSDKFNVNGVAPANGNVDVKEIYNSNKTQKIDGNGDVYVGETNTGGSWRHTNGAVMYYRDNSGSVYTWRTLDGRQSVLYSSENGNVTVTGNYYGTIRSGLNPLNGDDLGAVTSGVNVVTFTKQQTQFPDEPTTRFATLNDIPTELKCPNALTIQLNGTTAATYDGSAARTVNITTGGAPGATVASAALEYHADGQAISVSVAAAGTLTAVVNSWTDGQSQMAFVTLSAGASIAPAIKLIGYSEWPIGEEFMAVCTKRGSKIYVNPVCITEE